MVFSSLVFLGYFLPLFFIAYSLIRKNYRNALILIASILFYSWGEPRFIVVILISTFIDYYLVSKMYTSTGRNKQGLLFSSIGLNLGLLLYFKYFNFFIENTNVFLSSIGLSSVEWVNIALPIGISFYTFQTLTYSIDVYKGRSKPLDKLQDYLLYILSFPQMIAGPIVRFNEIALQINDREFLAKDKLIGFYRFAIGLAKKVLIANVMGEYADSVFSSDFEMANSAELWLGILAYTFQIYFDFSGYSDMAIGLGRMMGFKFPENFNSPYSSGSITEFWRRWHITLGAFMRDYLYIPLGGSRVKSKVRLYFNLWLVFLVSGLWHGASWSFVFWGAYHGFFLVIERLFLFKLYEKSPTILRVIITFFIVVIGWVFFRIEDFYSALQFISNLFDFSDFEIPQLTLKLKSILCMSFFFSFIYLTPFGKKVSEFLFERDDYQISMKIIIFILSAILFVVCFATLTSSGFNPFIYFRF